MITLSWVSFWTGVFVGLSVAAWYTRRPEALEGMATLWSARETQGA